MTAFEGGVCPSDGAWLCIVTLHLIKVTARAYTGGERL